MGNRKALTQHGDGTISTAWLLEKEVALLAVQRLGIAKRVTVHVLRGPLATHFLEAGTDIQMIQELLVHKDITATTIHTHVLNSGRFAISRPPDTLRCHDLSPQPITAIHLEYATKRRTLGQR